MAFAREQGMASAVKSRQMRLAALLELSAGEQIFHGIVNWCKKIEAFHRKDSLGLTYFHQRPATIPPTA